MKVLVQGSTGVLGRRVVKAFVSAGHEVVALARSDRGEALVRALGASPSRADVFDAQALARAAAGCEVVIRAATAIPKSARLRASDFAETSRLRTEGTKALLEAAAQAGARVFLQESIVWIARPADGAPFDENSPVTESPIFGPVAQAERMAAAVLPRTGLTATTLRLGNFYAADAWHTRFFGERLMRHKLPIIGSGESSMSILHVDDAASAFLAAAERPRAGLFHVVDNEPPTVRELLGAFADRLGARAPGRVPKWLARLAVGRESTEFFTVSMHTSNDRFRGAFRWAPRYPTYRETLDQVVEAWRAEGYLVGRRPA